MFLSNREGKLFYLFLISLFILACSKNYTRYHDDSEHPGLAIFSNTGNNILSCIIDGNAWRTVSRTTSGFSPVTQYEVEIIKKSTSVRDSLIITWSGYYQDNENNTGSLSLHMAVPSGFSYKNLAALQGQRLSIDTTVGFFTTGRTGTDIGSIKSSGNLYFHTARFDSVAHDTYTGVISGLFDANSSSLKIISGRFDHNISSAQIHF